MTNVLREINPVAAALLDQARSEHEQSAHTLAELELDAAAHIVRDALGEDAKFVVLEKDVDGSDDTRITVLVVRGGDDELIWVNHEDAYDYPGAEDLRAGGPDLRLPNDLRYPAEDHLERAYDLLGGADLALDVSWDDHFTADYHNILRLDLDAALTPTT